MFKGYDLHFTKNQIMKNKCMYKTVATMEERKPYISPRCLFYCLECKVMDSVMPLSFGAGAENPDYDGEDGPWQGTDGLHSNIWDEDTIFG